MAVATVITNSKEVPGMLSWSLLFALSKQEDNVVVLRSDSVAESEIKDQLKEWQDSGRDTPSEISIESIGKQVEESAILAKIDAADTALLVLGQNLMGETNNEDLAVLRKIFDQAFCDTIMLRLGNDEMIIESDQVLVPSSGGPHSRIALQLSSALAKRFDGEVVPLFVESDIGEEDGRAVGMRILEKFIDKAGLDRSDENHVKPQIVISNDVGRGIASAARQKKYDLVLVGASSSRVIKRKLFGIIPQKYLEGEDATTVALIRRRRPVGHRLRQRFEQFLSLRIPQLNRDERVSLFERLQTQSAWSFDFVALILLSTGIASLGMIQNSTAVVIGAMLVAPLMTPLLGSGLSLVQGNYPLILKCLKAIVLGFLSALVFSGVIGLIAHYTGLFPSFTNELLARGKPSHLDFGVAALSGVAASYCVARPSLSSALAGVAIAAALVPPIATVGISLALGEFAIAKGASLLFGTNVVSIMIASALTFFAIGIRGQLGAKTLWARRAIVFLLMLLIPLITIISNSSQNKNHQAVIDIVSKELKKQGVEHNQIRVLSLAESKSAIDMSCRIEAAKPITAEVAKKIKTALKNQREKETVRLKVSTDLLIE